MGKILIVIVGVVFVLSACGSNRQNSSNEIIKGKSVSVAGKVTQIERGKDGYTAEIKTGDGKTYFAVISSVNLAGSGEQYREVGIGEAIDVEGENVSSDGRTIRVTVLR